MDSSKKECILLFVKFPHRGLVKTRLAEKISPQFATELYKNFVLDTIKMLSGLPQDLKIFFDPPNDEDNFKNWLGSSYDYAPQQGSDLGQKMKNAFHHVFTEGFSKAVAIGSDSPDLPKEYIDLAFKAIDSHDAVIGPAGDGGYYLLGFSKESFLMEAFEDIEWSSSDVCDQTVNIMERRSKKVYLLPQWYDVDTPADLKALVMRNKNSAFRQSETLSYLIKNNFE
jgi:rSAM/selenodomain-associated transferase 1